MSEEMVDGDTGRKRSMVGGPRTEEGVGGGQGGWQDFLGAQVCG